MQNDVISIWWDGEGDFLSVTFAEGEGDMVQTMDGKAMVKIDDQGKILGFHLLGVSKKQSTHHFGLNLYRKNSKKVPYSA